MRRKMQAIATGVAISIALLTFVSTARATPITLSPTGAYNYASGTVTWSWGSIGQTLTCSSSSFSATLANDGTGTVPAGSSVYSSCSNALWGQFTFTQVSAYSVTTTGTLSGTDLSAVTFRFTIPPRGLLVRGTALGCSFYVSGSVDATHMPAVAAPSLSTAGPIPISRAALSIDSNTGGFCAAAFPVGLAMSERATYNSSRAATISR